MSSNPATRTYIQTLLSELEGVHEAYTDIVAASRIENIDPNRGSRAGVFVGFPKWGWAKSDSDLEAKRMSLLGKIRDWGPRFRLLFPHPTPDVAKKLDGHLDRMERWLLRHRDKDVPSTTDQAQDQIDKTIDGLRDLTTLLPGDEYPVRLVTDTNTLIDNPDLAVHTTTIGRRYVVHLLPVVLREIDDLKRGGNNHDLREAAKKSDRRLKGLRTNGNVREGVKVAGDVYCIFEHIEPRGDNLPTWLDLGVPDDRFIASALLLQSQHPGSALYAATGDINLQTKLAAVGLPFVELP